MCTVAERGENVKNAVVDELGQQSENVMSAVADTTARAEDQLGSVGDGLSRPQSDRI